MEFLFVYLLGNVLYGATELIYRGHTHWTMLLTGGICFLIMYFISGTSMPLWGKWLLSAAAITAVELMVGIVVNIIFGMRIWDYSRQSFNVLGQICPLFSMYWLGLSIPGIALCTLINRLF